MTNLPKELLPANTIGNVVPSTAPATVSLATFSSSRLQSLFEPAQAAKGEKIYIFYVMSRYKYSLHLHIFRVSYMA